MNLIVVTKAKHGYILDMHERRVICMNERAVDYHLAQEGVDRETAELARFTAEVDGQAIIKLAA